MILSQFQIQTPPMRVFFELRPIDMKVAVIVSVGNDLFRVNMSQDENHYLPRRHDLKAEGPSFDQLPFL